jgi:transposase
LKIYDDQYNNQFLNKTETNINYYVLNSNLVKKKKNHELNKKFAAPGFQKIKEKKVQESITSIDFED